jgi:hypothetical protein
MSLTVLGQALRDAAALLPLLISLARSAQLADPEEMSNLIEIMNARFEMEMFPRAFGWVNASNRSAEMDVTTWKGKAIIYLLWIIMSLGGCFSLVLEATGLKRPNGPHM